VPVPFAKEMWPDPEPHVLLTRGCQIIFREKAQAFLKGIRYVELTYDPKSQAIHIRPTKKRSTPRPKRKSRYFHTLTPYNNTPYSATTVSRFITENGLQISMLSRPMRYRAKGSKKNKTLTIYMNEGREEGTALQRRQDNAKT